MEDAIAASLTREEAPEHAYRILLDNQAVEVHEDGTTGRFPQLIAKVLNDRGIRDLDVYSISYAHGEQWVKVLLARVHHPDGRTDEARIRNRDPQVREGEYPLWSSVWLDLPPLEVGDVVEIEYLRQDLRQSFFGDYFGDEVVFAGTLPRERSVS
ncbi:MAG: DUF3857 domain-containing protein, partial [Planctomycetota bacterium]